MSTAAIAWIALAVYAIATLAIAFRGWRKTSSFKSFAVGAGDISPVVVGLSLSAQMTSVATFVANPGLVFAFGLSGFMGYGVAAALGIILGLVIFTGAFRKHGARVAALSVPQWIGTRFESKPLTLGFGVISLALVTYAVLIVVALAHVLHVLVGVDTTWLALVLIAFVFGYVMLGGANTHAYTNAVQAAIMLVVAVLLIASGLPKLWQGDGLFASLATQDPVLVQITNPKSLYFRNLFEVFVCNFLVGIALVCQPHILSKALYLKDDSQVRRFLAVGLGAGVVFLMVMWVGLFARTELAATTTIDKVVPTYIATHFSGGLAVLISIGLLAAGISTLEGILLGLTTIVSSDLYLGIFGRFHAGASDEQRGSVALRVGRASIVVLGVVTFVLSRWQILNPTGGSVAIFAQYGVYLLISASVIPLAAGMFMTSARRSAVTGAALAAVLGYVATDFFDLTTMNNNPAFLLTMGLTAGAVIFVLLQVVLPALVSRPGARRSAHTLA